MNKKIFAILIISVLILIFFITYPYKDVVYLELPDLQKSIKTDSMHLYMSSDFVLQLPWGIEYITILLISNDCNI
jgi:hypothetical protein